MKKTKPKLPSRKAIVRRLDTAFSKYIRARDYYSCVTCDDAKRGPRGRMQCGHVLSRVCYATRWDAHNAFCQCEGCNLTHEHNPFPLIAHAVKEYGWQALVSLDAKWRRPVSFTTFQLHEFMLYWEREAHKMENARLLETCT